MVYLHGSANLCTFTVVTGDECYPCPESCIRCSNASYCSDCYIGYWGVHCENSCLMSCKNSNCDKEFGRCTEGCSDGYFLEGDICLHCPYNCLLCGDLHSCSKCKTGYWGSSCEAACPVTCNRCTMNGQCLTGKLKLVNVTFNLFYSNGFSYSY